jgi:phosphoribosylformimino-5-aminoimidazole carboxamide ribotide isomerase
MRNAECETRSNDLHVKESETSLRIPRPGFRILPVLDLLNGIVVLGVGGRRDEYQPISSVLTDSAEPLAVARAFRERLGLSTLYIADLDAIVRQQPNRDIYRQLAEDGFELWIDAGLRTASEAHRLLQAGASQVIVGLETLPDIADLNEFLACLGPDRMVFSLDLKAGRPLLASTGPKANSCAQSDPRQIAEIALAAGVTQMIVLDLGSVGEQAGLSTLSLCRDIRRANRFVRLITGGGVRDATDLQQVRAAGVNGVLLATSLHRGTIGRADVDDVALWPDTVTGRQCATDSEHKKATRLDRQAGPLEGEP